MKVQKRQRGNEPVKIVEFDLKRIINAIMGAMRETLDGEDEPLAVDIANKVEKYFIEKNKSTGKDIVTVEEIQDTVEMFLMKSHRPDVAKKYILYREQKLKSKPTVYKKADLLSDEFISKYKHLPNPMSQFGQFIYYRTYSRFLPEEGRREYWWETVKRAVEYNCSLVPTSRKEAEELYDNIFNLRQFLSGRTTYIGGTQSAKNYPMSNYNCAFQIIDSFTAFEELFYLLMLGSGVGLRILKEDVQKLPKVRTNIDLIHEAYTAKPKAERDDNTSITFSQNVARIIVGDSKEGWMQSLRYFFDLMYRHEYRDIIQLTINYDNVRPKGEKLKKFGGTASGHSSLKDMFIKIDNVIKRAGLREGNERTSLRPIDCLDIANIIGENVVSGGVRRSSEIMLIDADDEECINAKSNIYQEVNGVWTINKEIAHRQMSNNSIYYKSKPTREKLHWQIGKMRYSGEPAWINGEAMNMRSPSPRHGVNPCGEILLDDKGMCNLTTVNVMAFVKDGKLQREELLKAQRLSVRAGYRMTCVEMELPKWNDVLQRDKLVGCSLTGWQDMVNATSMSKEEQIELLKDLRKVARQEAESYAKNLNQNIPILVTTVKPEGTLSLLPTVSSGVHYSHSPYYIRRVRISSSDPLVKVCEELGYPVFPESGQDWATCKTKVVEFPVKAPEGRTKYDVTAIEQLENYKMFMEHYADHNTSITVHVRDNEWDEVEQWVWDNWDTIVGVTFLSLDDNFYDLMPYEAITKEEYEKRINKMRPFIPSLISKYEVEQKEHELLDKDCASGACPIR